MRPAKPKKAAETAPLSIRISVELRAELERLAEADGRTMSNYVSRALQQHVDGVRKAKSKRL